MKPLLFLSALYPLVLSASEFPEVYNSEPEKSGSPPSAAEAASSFKVPDGFQVTVFASEPEVRNPVAMAWDHRGRLWIAENYTYAEKGVRFDMTLRDRVLIFEDTDGDGKADSRKVFTDEVQTLTSVEIGRGGVWLMCPPQLLFVPDADGNDVPDSEPEVVLDGFTIAKSNYHNFANGLRWGPDGWLYGRCGGSCPGDVGAPGTPADKRVPLRGGIWRFHPERKVFEALTHGTTNPWGHDWDENGELFFINTVIGHIFHMIPGAHLNRPFGRSVNPLVFEPIFSHADHRHFDTKGSWTDSRDGKANDFGGGHSHIGTCIYQADHLPENWRGKLMVWNQHGRRANVERLERHGSGYVARHEPDVFVSGDKWFCGIDLRTGPDGALYAIDWSDTGECHEHTGVHRTSGRIYRFSHGEAKKPDLSDFGKLDDPAALLRLLKHPNVWFERQARQLLAGTEAKPEIVAELTELLTSKEPTPFRLRALWMLNALGAAEHDLVFELINDADEHLRSWAIRLLTDTWPLDPVIGSPQRKGNGDDQVTDSLTLLATIETSPQVRLMLASTLQRLSLNRRAEIAFILARHKEDASDHNLPGMVWFGMMSLVESNPEALVALAAETEWPKLLRWISRALAGAIEEQPGKVVGLLEIAKATPDKAPHMLRGIADGLKGWQRAPKSANWDAVSTALASRDDCAELVRELGGVFGDGRALEDLRKIVLDKMAELPAREAALRSLIDARPPDLRKLCEGLLRTRKLNKTAVRGLAVFDDPEIGKRLAANYHKWFRPTERPPVVDVLVSRPAWAGELLGQIERSLIPREDLTPYHAQQIAAFGDEKLSAKLVATWGSYRETDAAKREQIESLEKELNAKTLAGANLTQGRVLSTALCSSCHQLYGEGGKLGPDLTGSGRADLSYLLENMVDPSAVVPAEYQMSVVKTKDGRVLSGVVAARADRTITLRTLTEDITIEKGQIESTTLLPYSIMPEGLLMALSPEQRRDLIAYLMHPRQVPLPGSGTP